MHSDSPPAQVACASDETSASFRFPTPPTDEGIQWWVGNNISPELMATLSDVPLDEPTLVESTYEFIDTDGEGRDDYGTESCASTDFGRPDDVASLEDTEQSVNSDEDDGLDSIPHRSYSGPGRLLGTELSTPTMRYSAGVITEEFDKPLTQSIEFEESFSLGAETVSVKHTVVDFNEEQTAKAISDVNMTIQNPPSRLLLTIRQTMTRQGLSTKEPLRILYVGSHLAKRDIIHKIASSVTASVENGRRTQSSRQSMSQLYNVVPVSDFGSERTPEIELMHSSGYQIQVEDCVSAEHLKFKKEEGKPDVIRLTLEDDFSYHSAFDGVSFVVQPEWERPHVAIFYYSEIDDIELRRTRSAARAFMSRHAVPSIVISHEQLLTKPPNMALDPHSIHMCLESREHNGRGNVILQRLPIDLASFLNIDARQMNRNLAYLTRLHEPLDNSTLPSVMLTSDKTVVESKPLNRLSESGNTKSDVIASLILLVSILATILSTVAFVSFRDGLFGGQPSTSAISVNSKVMSALPIHTMSTTSSLILQNFSTSTVSMNIPTETGIRANYPGPNSISLVPSIEFDKPRVTAGSRTAGIKTYLCTAEIVGGREILIRIPSTTKLRWLASEAISINVTRGNIIVDTERVYSTAEGIVLSLAKSEAYGVLDIDILTTKKPRVNETFQVDFGTSTFQLLQAKIDPKLILEHIINAAEGIANKAWLNADSNAVLIGEKGKVVLEHVVAARSQIFDTAKSVSLEATKKSAILVKEFGIQFSQVESVISKKLQLLNTMKTPLKEEITKAQIQSKLLWLKMQGKELEHKQYQEGAARASLAQANSKTGKKRDEKK